MKMRMRKGIAWLAAWLVSGAALVAGPVDDGRAAYEKKEFATAYETFSKAFRDNPDNIDAAIGLGLSAMALGHYDRSQFAFERVLSLDPLNHTARLELARSYLAMGMPDVARLEYERLLESQPPEAVRLQIEKELDQAVFLQKRVFWSGRATLEGIYDSNIRFGPAKDFVGTRLGDLRVAKESEAKAASGGAVSIYENGLFDFGDRNGWAGIAGGGAYVERFSGAHDYEAQDFDVYGGLRRATGAKLLDLPLKARLFLMDWDRVVTIGGFNPLFGWAPNDRWRLYTAAGLEERDFDDDYRDSVYLSLTQTFRRYFGASGSASLAFSAGAFREDADLGGYDREGLDFNLTGDYRLPWEVLVTAGAGYMATRYDEVLYTLLQSDAREDSLWRGSLTLSRPLSDRLTTALTWAYEETDSNFDLYSYRRHEVRLGATVWF